MARGFTKNEIMIGIPVAVTLVGLVIWGMWYEFARAHDAKRYGEALVWHSAFALYFHMHGVYPSSPSDGMSLQGICLIDEGFVPITDKSCVEAVRVYNKSDESTVLYYPRTANNEPCSDTYGCRRYYMTVPQQTTAISGQSRDIFRLPPRGLHILDPEGLHVDQKIIPGI